MLYNLTMQDKNLDLTGFDKLWQVSFKETQDFIRAKSASENQQAMDKEISLLQKELDEKDFEIQKLQWQLFEREKELKNLYEELHKSMDLNGKLNNQLHDFEALIERLKSLIDSPDYSAAEPVLPKF